MRSDGLSRLTDRGGSGLVLLELKVLSFEGALMTELEKICL